MTSSILALIATLGTVLKRVVDYFGAQAQLERRKLAEARREAEERVEKERLVATLRRISEEKRPRGAELLDRLNRKPDA